MQDNMKVVPNLMEPMTHEFKGREIDVDIGDQGVRCELDSREWWNVYSDRIGSHQAENQKVLLAVFIYGLNVHFSELTWHFHSIASFSLILVVLKEFRL